MLASSTLPDGSSTAGSNSDEYEEIEVEKEIELKLNHTHTKSCHVDWDFELPFHPISSEVVGGVGGTGSVMVVLLAMIHGINFAIGTRWHPYRCLAFESSKHVEETKKFPATNCTDAASVVYKKIMNYVMFVLIGLEEAQYIKMSRRLLIGRRKLQSKSRFHSSRPVYYWRNAQTRQLSHPLAVLRAHEIDEWSRSLDYKSLMKQAVSPSHLQEAGDERQLEKITCAWRRLYIDEENATIVAGPWEFLTLKMMTFCKARPDGHYAGRIAQKTNAWRKIVSATTNIYYAGSNACFFNGTLHWVVDCKLNDIIQCRIITFDLSTNVFGFISLPKTDLDYYAPMIFKGCLAVMCMIRDRGDHCSIWVMREYNDVTSWTKAFDILEGILMNEDHKDSIWYNHETRTLSRLTGDSGYTFEKDMCVESLELLDKEIVRDESYV
ncbi:F-box domain-containing protein [Artemisia annua]|uniref:F-box domain-containing protein n=1 Tax=Artemisia annua TaxID=35608 RepID=A0A2U1MXP4_ARTAN|nr:F-box domain-containing protein [Artemisia annua]